MTGDPLLTGGIAISQALGGRHPILASRPSESIDLKVLFYSYCLMITCMVQKVHGSELQMDAWRVKWVSTQHSAVITIICSMFMFS